MLDIDFTGGTLNQARYIDTWCTCTLEDLKINYVTIHDSLLSQFSTATAVSHTRPAKCNIVSNISVNDF